MEKPVRIGYAVDRRGVSFRASATPGSSIARLMSDYEPALAALRAALTAETGSCVLGSFGPPPTR